MYTKHFGFSAAPFSISPDPHYLYMSEQHREALAHLSYVLQSDGGIVLLTGEVGTGKTTVCRCFLEQLPENCELAYIVHPKLTVAELLATICDEFGIAYEHHGMKHLIDHLHQYLLQAHSHHRRTVLLIDEAQNLSPDVLEQLRLLTNLETNQKKLLQIILLGQPELQEMLGQKVLRQLSQRIVARYHLQALNKEEVTAYIKHRLHISGVSHSIFSTSSIKRAYQHSQGIPRLINLFCDRALLGAYSQHHLQVSTQIMQKAIQEVLGEQIKPKQNLERRLNLWFLLLMCCVFLWYSLQPETIRSIQKVQHIKSMSKPVSKDIGWPPQIKQHAQHVFQAMLQQWGIDHVFKKPVYQRIPSYGLNCMQKKGNWQRLRQLNRPVILHLFDAQQQPFDALLVKLKHDQATLLLGGNTYELSTQTIDRYWYGEYLLLWRSLAYIRPSPQHEKLMRIIQRIQHQPQSEDVAAIKHFQAQQGLQADGVIGQQTLIHLYMAMDTYAPRLLRDQP